MAVQFHPEKSHKYGLNFLNTFLTNESYSAVIN